MKMEKIESNFLRHTHEIVELSPYTFDASNKLFFNQCFRWRANSFYYESEMKMDFVIKVVLKLVELMVNLG